MKSNWQSLKEEINKHKVGDFIYRKNLRIWGMSMTYVDNTRRQLTVCGYLEDTGEPGKYKLLKPLERDLTTTKLRKMYDMTV